MSEELKALEALAAKQRTQRGNMMMLGNADPEIVDAIRVIRATDAENQRLRAEVEALREADAEALAEATSLAIFLWKQHYRHVPQWKPLPDTRGVISQIDNMTAGMRDRLTAMKTAGDGLAGFAGHTDDCREGLAAWGEVEACSCGYTEAWKQWKEASDGL